MNLGQLKTAVGRKLSMDTTLGSDDSNALIAWANEGVVDVLLRTKCYVTSGDMTLAAGVGDYRMDTQLIVFVGAYNTSSSSPLERRSIAQLLDLRRGSTSPGSTLYYALRGDLLMVYPAPAATTVFRFYLVPRPTPMAVDSEDPSNPAFGGVPVEYHKALEAYMFWQGLEYQGDLSGSGESAYERRLDRVVRALMVKGVPLPRARLAVQGSGRNRDPAVYP